MLGQLAADKDSVVLTRNRAHRQQQEEEELQHREKESEVKPTTLESLGESEAEKQDREEELEGTKPKNKEQETEQLDEEPGEDRNEDHQGSTRDDPLLTEYGFSNDIFLQSNKEKKYLSRAQKREGRLQHAKAEKKSTGRDWVLGLSQDELRRLQEKDKTLNSESRQRTTQTDVGRMDYFTVIGNQDSILRNQY